MNPITEEKQIRTYFLVSIFLKGAISFVECVAGVLAFFIPIAVVTDFVIRATAVVLPLSLEGLIIPHLTKIADEITATSATFIGLYLLSRGFIKLVLIIAMLKNELRAYPLSLIVLGGFVSYQIYQIVTHFSAAIVILTIFDLIVMYFIWKEYEVLCRHPLAE